MSTSPKRSPLVAATLSFVLPGLGQLWAGARRRGIAYLLPVLLALLAALLLWLRSPAYLIGVLLQPDVLLALLVVNAGLFVFRTIAILDAFAVSARARTTRPTAVAVVGVVLLLVLTAGSHLALGYVDYQARDLVTGVFDDEGGGLVGGQPEPTPSPAPTATPQQSPGGSTEPTIQPTPEPTPQPTPADRPWALDGRLNVLIVGADAGPGRWGVRTDTLILASVEVETGRAALFGIPRNLVNVPLPEEAAPLFACHCYPDLLNSLYQYAGAHPDNFPGGDKRGYRAVAGAIEVLTGVQLDGMVVADLNGFIALVDALGGLDINVPEPVVDNAYPTEDGTRFIRISIPAGQQHMDGSRALQYARSRHQDSDYGRMRRQQLVLVALRRQANICAMLPRLGDLVRIGKETLTTDIPVTWLPGLLELTQRVEADRIARVTFAPPAYPSHLRSSDVRRIREKVATIFETPAEVEPTLDPGAAGAC
jgi:LCP family protein required for cell wall assembly